MACPELFGVVKGDGKFYTRTPPQCASPNWLGTAKEIGMESWNDFEHLFFHPDGTLYGVLNDRFYKGPPPQGSSATAWVNQATLIGNVGWKGFQFLFFHPDGTLYGVYNDMFYKRFPPGYPGTDPDWLEYSVTCGIRRMEGLQIPLLRSQRTLTRSR